MIESPYFVKDNTKLHMCLSFSVWHNKIALFELSDALRRKLDTHFGTDFILLD